MKTLVSCLGVSVCGKVGTRCVEDPMIDEIFTHEIRESLRPANTSRYQSTCSSLGDGQSTVREYCFERENSLSSASNSVSSAKILGEFACHTNKRWLRGIHWALCLKPCSLEPCSALFQLMVRICVAATYLGGTSLGDAPELFKILEMAICLNN